MTDPHHTRYLANGLQCLRDERWFDAHEEWEIPWKTMHGHVRWFWQAMIQLSVGAYHHSRGNRTGCRNLWHKARRRCRQVRDCPDLAHADMVDTLDALLADCLAREARGADPLSPIRDFARRVVTPRWYDFR